MRSFVVTPGGSLTGGCAIPGDKSISHRAIMLAAISEGRSRVSGFLPSADCVATRDAFAAMGVTIVDDANDLVIDGVGLHGLQAPQQDIDLGNAGTGMRLLSGLLAGQAFDARVTGDASLRSRPMGRIIEPLRAMGAAIRGDANDCAPLAISGGQALRGITYESPVASAQVKSCLLLAGLYADGAVTVREPGISRDHSERMLRAFGADIDIGQRRVTLHGATRLAARDISVPADLSSAAFFMVGAAIGRGSELRLPGVGINPTRRGVIDILLAMGADVTLANERDVSGEPVADITVRASALQGVDIGGDTVALAIDEFPALFIAAACAKGVTRLRDARELRVKESDRIAVMAEGLATLGADVQVYDDGIAITGRPDGCAFGGGHIESHDDHRIAMAFAMAALRASAPITINNCDNVATSFPDFVGCARAAGLDIAVPPEA